MTIFRFGIGVLAISLAACGGNYSNDDFLFRSAVPNRDDLRSKLTDADAAALRWTSEQHLSTGSGVSTGVAVGDVSGVAKFTLGASEGFNQGLFTILDILEAVVSIEPSERHPDQRIWGPYPDGKHPGFEVRLVMSRAGQKFEYHVDARHQGSTEDWAQIVKGDYEATGSLRKGTGSLHYLATVSRAIGYDLEVNDGAAIDVSYQTASDPVTVDLVIPSLTNPVPIFAFSYAGSGDGSGQMRFEVSGQLVGGVFSPLDTLDVVSRWKVDGSGRGDAEVTAGDYVGAAYVECWSAADTILYSDASWGTPVGLEADCPVF